jgi:ParB family transcriptional regulator, chromosome partitioning protein
MSKREDLLRAGGANVLASMGTGRGPELPAGLDPASAIRKPAHLEGLARDKSAARISIDRIAADPDQPRREFDPEELERLAESMRTRGQLQPIRVRWSEGQGSYVVIMGERRWRAAKMAGLAELACVVQEEELTPEDRLAVQLVENALRSDLRPLEQAHAYRALMEAKGWSTRQLGAELAIHATTITKALALLELPAEVQDRVEQGGLSPATAYEVSKLEGPEAQAEMAQVAIAEKLTRSEVAEAVKAVKARRPAAIAKPDPVTLDLGDVAVKIIWKKGNASVAQALRRALKEVQERERQGEVDAA